MTKGEKFLEKEVIDDMIISVNEKGEQVFVSDLIDKALNEQLILSGVSKSFTLNQMDDAYDKGYNDGYETGGTIM